MHNSIRLWCSRLVIALVLVAVPLALAHPVFAQDDGTDGGADGSSDGSDGSDGGSDGTDDGTDIDPDPEFTDPAGDPSTGDPGADVESPPAEGADTSDPEPGGEGEDEGEGEGETAEPEEDPKKIRQRHLRSSGWTINRALPRTHASIWITHWNDDLARFIHDAHLMFEYAVPLNEDMTMSGWSMFGFRFQGSSTPTGFDNWWLGAKLSLANARKSTFSFGVSVGLPIGRRQGGTSVVFSDSANGQLIAFQDFALDFAFLYTLTTEDFGLSLDLHMNVPVGLRQEFVFQGGAEAVFQMAEKVDVRGGFMFSTAFTPFTIYLEGGYLTGDDMTASVRVQIPLGDGDNFGNVADLMIFLIFDFRFHLGDES